MINAVWSKMDAPTGPQPIIDATNQFAQRRYKWKPTPEDMRALRDVVNRRAGWALME
jgi:bifunctional pyridoxal-dependent enzyme with beta-cystathionase and maltose regulon repressor activities